MTEEEMKAWKTVREITDRGETAEVRMTKDGYKVLELQRKLRYGKSACKK